ncbi:MAG TPA: TonB-dependent receptor [Chitinophagaceae bacterium]|nr:TonB-dependent receptor [Chitinophagaceae bacterium]
MKKVVLAAIALLMGLSVMAQFPSGGQGKKFPALPDLGHVYGKIVDSAGKPIAGASVLVLQKKFDTTTKKAKTVLVKGSVTENNGEFNFEDLPLMGVTVKISASGFEEKQMPVMFFDPSKMKQQSQPAQGGMPTMPSFDKDLGKVELKGNPTQLQGVIITASAPTVKMDIDKKVFNVDKNIESSGGTAVDVMRNVPSVQVDIDGNVKLRNATPQIYIDGRPTTLTLDEIPADAIQSVEVITNPSAKYDASGGNAGILNLILKKNRKTGYNGNLMAGVDSRGGYNGGGSFNVRQGKINFSANAFTHGMNNKATGTTNRYTYGTDPTHVFQKNIDHTTGMFVFGRLGLDYYVSNNTTLSAGIIKVHGDMHPSSDITTDSLDEAGNIFKYNDRSTVGPRSFNATGGQLSFMHNFQREGEQLTFDGNFFSGKNSGNANYVTSNFLGDKTFIGNSYEQQLSNGTNLFSTLQSDYVNPLTKNTKLEAGVRAQFRNTTNDNDIYIGSAPGALTKIANLTNNYKNTDNVFAAYSDITSAIGKNFGYELGLRAESSNYQGELTNTGQSFKHTYPVSLFPSVFLSQKLKNNQELQLNYSRRINRPNFFQLIPYYDFSDSLNITKGNPDLVPEFTNSLEFSYSKTFKGNNTLLVSVYYKHSTNLITRYLDTEVVNNQNLLVNTYMNANSSYSYGAEFTSVNNFTKWWDVTTNINLYQSKINTSNIPNSVSQDAILSWFGKLNNEFKLKHNFTIQLSGNYQSKTNLPVSQNQGQMGPPGMQAQSSSQGYIRPFWSVDVAVRKTFLKNQAASVSLGMSDIFRTASNEQISSSPGIFYQDYYRLNNPQLVRLTFSYRFGKMDVSLFKRQVKNNAAQDAIQASGQ